MYEITITKIEDVKKLVGKDWGKIGESNNPIDADGDRRDVSSDNKTYNVYGYTPEIEKTKRVETELLKQTVEELDFSAVIKAINKL